MLEAEQSNGLIDQFLKTILSPGFEWQITVAEIIHIVTVDSPKVSILDNSGKTQSVTV